MADNDDIDIKGFFAGSLNREQCYQLCWFGEDDSFSELDDDFDHTIGLSAPSSVSDSHENLQGAGLTPETTPILSRSQRNGVNKHNSNSCAKGSIVYASNKDNEDLSGYKLAESKSDSIMHTDPFRKPRSSLTDKDTSFSHVNSQNIVNIRLDNEETMDTETTNNAICHKNDSRCAMTAEDSRNPEELRSAFTKGIHIHVVTSTPLKQCNGLVNGVGVGALDLEGCEGDDEEEETESASMAVQLCQLQEMVGEMKSHFSTAVAALAEIQHDDQELKQTVEANRAEYERQMMDVLQMVLALKNELARVLTDLHAATDSQAGLRQQVEGLQCERDILLEELERAGVVSAKLREKYHSGVSRSESLRLSAGPSNSNLSGLLERARLSFSAPPRGGATSAATTDTEQHSDRSGGGGGPERRGAGGPGSQNSSRVTSDSGVTSGQVGDEDAAPHSPLLPVSNMAATDEGGDAGKTGRATHTAVSPMMDSYIAQQQQLSFADAEANDESDSSLTAAANKSLDLSRSLGNACSEGLGLEDNSEEEGEVKQEGVGEEAEVEKPRASCTQSQGTKAQNGAHTKSDSCVSEFKRPLTPPSNKLAPHERNARDVQRGRVIRELIDTEKKYCSCLWTLMDHFSARLQESSVVSQREVGQMIPGSVWRLYEHHCAFLQKLDERLNHGKWQCVVGDVVSRFIESSECDLLKQYQSYLKDFPTAMQTIRKTCRASTKFKKLLKDTQQHPRCEGLDVNAFLLTPVQRMPRYVLLLQQLLKQTDGEHPDHYYLESSLQRLGDFLNQLNDSIESSMALVQPEQPQKPKKRLRDRIPSFRRTNTAEALLDSSPLDTSLDASTISSLDGSRFRVSPRRSARPLSVHGCPSLMRSGSNTSLQAVSLEGLVAEDGTVVVQDRTGRLIPVKAIKVKRASKLDMQKGQGLSSSFHGVGRPNFSVGGGSGRASPKRGGTRPLSLVLDSFPEHLSGSVLHMSRASPARSMSNVGNVTSSIDEEYSPVVSISQRRTHSYTHVSPDSGDVLVSHGSRHETHFAQKSYSDSYSSPSHSGRFASSSYSPRTHGAHVHTNGSLSYNQRMRKAQREKNASAVYGTTDSESDFDSVPISSQDAVHPAYLQARYMDSSHLQHITSAQLTQSLPQPKYSSTPQVYSGQKLTLSMPQSALKSAKQHMHFTPPPPPARFDDNPRLRSQSVIEFNREKAGAFKSQSTADFSQALPQIPPAIDDPLQHNINISLARSLTLREEPVSNTSPVSMRSTHSNPTQMRHSASQPYNESMFYNNAPTIPPPKGFEYKPQLGSIDRPGLKLSNKRHSAKRYESPTKPVVVGGGSGLSCKSEVWQPDANSSLIEQDMSNPFISASAHNMSSITGSPRKVSVELSKKEQKQRQQRLAAQSVGDLGTSAARKPKSSIRQSLKNIFFRKNDVDIAVKSVTHGIIEEESSKLNGSVSSLMDSSRGMSQTPPTVRASPQDKGGSLVISNVTLVKAGVSLEDGGEPCSAV